MMKNIFCCFLLISNVLFAGVLVTDDFNDNDFSNWSVLNTLGSTTLTESGGVLSKGDDGTIGFIVHNNLVTSNHFILEADVRLDTPVSHPVNGHVGLGWGIVDASNYNNTYLRLHMNQLTSWSLVNGSLNGPENLHSHPLSRNTFYHLSVEVDYINEIMKVDIDGSNVTYSGAAFQQINPHGPGGMVGLRFYREPSSFDNFSYTDLAAVPEPSTYAMLALGVLGLGVYRKRRKK